jgi:exodeoxyribonuclease VII small subunit
VSSRSRKSPLPDIEASLGELEKLVERMERGEQPLEQSLQDFERGMELARQCETTLRNAEQRVEKLVRRGEDHETEPFEPDETEPAD